MIHGFRIARLARVAVFLCCAGAVPASAAIDPALASRVHRAARTILTLPGESPGALPRVSNPTVRALFETLGETAALSGAQVVAQDMPLLLGLGDDLTPLLHRYLDLKTEDGKVDLMDNTLAYQDELARLMSASVDLFVTDLEAGPVFLRSLPPEQVTKIRLDGLAGARRGAAEIIRGTLATINTRGITDDNRRRLAAALSRNATVAARHLEPEALAFLQNAARQLSTGAFAANLRGDLLAFAEAPGDAAR